MEGFNWLTLIRWLINLNYDKVLLSITFHFCSSGCGAYCDNSVGAVSTTGHGESIMKVTLARDIIYNMQQGKLKCR